MKKIFLEQKFNASAIAIVAMLSTSPFYLAQAQAAGSSSNYVGVDAIYSSMKFKKDYGDNIFNKKMIPGINVFAGHMFNENWGVEAGYEADKKMKTDNIRVNSGPMVAGNMVEAGHLFLDYNTAFKQYHTYLGAIGKYNAFNNNNLFASLMLGISMTHVNANLIILRNIVVTHINLTRSFTNTKLIPIIRATLEYKVTDQLGFRASTTWKKTSTFKMLAKEQPSTAIIKLKDTINIGAGVIYYIN